MFERCSPEARYLIVAAQAQARRLGHRWLGCEHLLLALAQSDTVAGELLRDGGAQPEAVEAELQAVVGLGTSSDDDKVALAALGIDLDEVRSVVEATFGAGALEAATARRRRRGRRRCAPDPAVLRFTPKAKRCLAGALKEALRQRSPSIEPHHLALSLLAHDDTVAWEVLARLGADAGVLRRSIDAAGRRSA